MRPNPTPSFPEREGPNHRSTQIVLRDSGAFLPLVAHQQNLMAETVRRGHSGPSPDCGVIEVCRRIPPAGITGTAERSYPVRSHDIMSDDYLLKLLTYS
jgi:hypothetical protein